MARNESYTYLGHKIENQKCKSCGELEQSILDFDTQCQKPAQYEDKSTEEPRKPILKKQKAIDPILSVLNEMLEEQQKQSFMVSQQLQILKAIRWAIVGFAIWFIIQAWILPNISTSSR